MKTHSEVDFDQNFGIKEKLDSFLAESMMEALSAKWEEEQEQLETEWYEVNGEDCDEEFEREEKPDFEMMAYECMDEMYHCWDTQFKQDCIDYYLAHKDA